MHTIIFSKLHKTEGPKFIWCLFLIFFTGDYLGPRKFPIRKWYGCLGELRALFPKECQLLVLTATATKTTKQQILQTLHLSEGEMKVIEQSPGRPNLFYVTSYLDKNEDIESAFSSLIFEVKEVDAKTPRTLIYCQTRKQCAVLYRIFEMYLGRHMYHTDVSPRNSIVEMYHAGTPVSVKDHILMSMATEDGHVRILICTVTFGMGVNCGSVRRVIHFGPLNQSNFMCKNVEELGEMAYYVHVCCYTMVF